MQLSVPQTLWLQPSRGLPRQGYGHRAPVAIDCPLEQLAWRSVVDFTTRSSSR